jgi:hypothetical protein
VAPGALQVVGEAGIFQSGQSLPAIGGHDELPRDVAGEAVGHHRLEDGDERLRQLTHRQHGHGERNPGREGQRLGEDVGPRDRAEVECHAIHDDPRQHQLHRAEQCLEGEEQQNAQDQAGASPPGQLHAKPDEPAGLPHLPPERCRRDRIAHCAFPCR